MLDAKDITDDRILSYALAWMLENLEDEHVVDLMEIGSFDGADELESYAAVQKRIVDVMRKKGWYPY